MWWTINRKHAALHRTKRSNDFWSTNVVLKTKKNDNVENKNASSTITQQLKFFENIIITKVLIFLCPKLARKRHEGFSETTSRI